MDYQYILLTIGKDKARNRLILHSKIQEYVKPEDKDVLISLFWYGGEAVKFFQKNQSLKGYRNEMWIPFLPFDIDSGHDEPLEVACSKTKKLLKELEEKGIDQYRISFSGSRGFHVIVDSSYFGEFKPSASLPAQLLALAKNLTTVGFDKSIYSNLRMFRLTNSLHHTSGLYKINILPELLDYPEKIKELAKTQQPILKNKKPESVKSLVKLKDDCFNLVPDDNTFVFTLDSKPKMKLCISNLLKGVGSGDRNNAACRIISNFKQQGYEPNVAYEFLHSWNKFNTPPATAEELKETFQSIWEGGYTYGCYDFMLDENCDKACYLYQDKTKKTEVLSSQNEMEFVSISSAVKQYDEFIKEDKRIKLGVSEKIDKEIRGIAPGQSGVILGRPTAGKSLVAQHICQNFVKTYPGYCLYVSMEMPKEMLFEREAQILTGMQTDYIEQNYKNIKFSSDYDRYLVLDKVGVSIPELEKSILRFQENHDKIELIIVDFLHALKVNEGGMDEKSRIGKAVLQLTELPRKLNTRLLYLAHVHRTMGKDDSVYSPCRMGDGKDSSVIENNAFFIFGVHLIRDDPNCIVFQLLKNKHGAPLETGVQLEKTNGTLQLKERKGLYLPEEE